MQRFFNLFFSIQSPDLISASYSFYFISHVGTGREKLHFYDKKLMICFYTSQNWGHQNKGSRKNQQSQLVRPTTLAHPALLFVIFLLPTFSQIHDCFGGSDQRAIHSYLFACILFSTQLNPTMRTSKKIIPKSHSPFFSSYSRKTIEMAPPRPHILTHSSIKCHPLSIFFFAAHLFPTLSSRQHCETWTPAGMSCGYLKCNQREVVFWGVCRAFAFSGRLFTSPTRMSSL